MEFVIITGMSGAGKSRAVDALEDIGFFCADNMPPKLMPTFAQLLLKSQEKREKVAIVTDIRVGDSFNDLFNALDELNDMGFRYKMLFVEASDNVLMHRYKETRRKHPLQDKYEGSLEQSIAAERKILRPARQIADYIVDTSFFSAIECKEHISALFLDNPDQSMKIRCVSFGYKYGMPSESDLVFDVRCLPNPFYVDELKEHTGLEEPVRDYVMKWDEARNLVPKIFDLVDYLLPLYRSEGKSQLVISFGCTGGRHRSVVFAELMKEHMNEKEIPVSINHRDISK